MSLKDPFQASQDLDEVWASRLLVILVAHSMRFVKKQASTVEKKEMPRADSHPCQADGENRRFCCLVLV